MVCISIAGIRIIQTWLHTRFYNNLWLLELKASNKKYKLRNCNRALICFCSIKGPSIQVWVLNGKLNNLQTAILHALQHFSKPVELLKGKRWQTYKMLEKIPAEKQGRTIRIIISIIENSWDINNFVRKWSYLIIINILNI